MPGMKPETSEAPTNSEAPSACETSSAGKVPATCEAPDQSIYSVSFEEARKSYGDQKFWVSFFVRPCCPPPNGETAKKQLDKQRDMVRAREDFSEEQISELLALIDEGEAWYRSTPYWK